MLGITDLGGYLLGLVLIVLLPGPNSLYVLSVAARRGVRVGYAAACGVFLGDAVLMVLAALGVASVLMANPVLFTAVQWLGAGYLAWLAFGMLRQAWRLWRNRAVPLEDRVADAVADAAPDFPAVTGESLEHPFRRALIVSILNPKAILFMFAFFVQFVDPTYAAPALTFVVLGAMLEIASFLYLSTLILVGTRLARVFRERRALAAGGSSAIGALFLGFAVKLLASPVH